MRSPMSQARDLCARAKIKFRSVMGDSSSIIIRLPKVLEMTGLSRTTVWRQVKAGTFPRPVKLGARAVGWPVSAVDEWLRSRPAA